jgi:hypothetical protein
MAINKRIPEKIVEYVKEYNYFEKHKIFLEFESKLETLINQESIDVVSKTPDFVIARYLTECLKNFIFITNERDRINDENKTK